MDKPRVIAIYVNVVRSSENVVLFFFSLLIVCVMINAVGGVDLSTYRDNSYLPFGEWGAYFIKEFLSWSVIKFCYELSDFLGLAQPVFLLTFFLFLLLYISTAGFKLDARYLPLALVAPLSILLAFNILRQYIAIFFLFLAILMLLHKRTFCFFLLCVFATLSHNSVSLVLIVVIFCYWLSFRAALFLLLMTQLSLFLLNRLFDLNIYSSDGYNDDGMISSSVKVAFHFVYIFFLYAMFEFSYGIGRGKDALFFKKLGRGLLAFSILTTIFPWPFWVANRFLIYVAFLYLGLLLVCCEHWTINRRKYNFFVLFIVFFNMLAIGMHKGATEMIYFDLFIG